ncbi:MAG: hypothetical protein AAGC57_07420 [Pseudomonadota bacterium]
MEITFQANADHEETDAHLERGLGKACQNRCRAGPQEENDDHAVSAPALGKPSGGHREEAEGQEAGRGMA